MSDEATREKIRQAIITHSSAVGLGLICPHCGGGLAGGDWNSFWNTVKHPETWAERITNEITNPNSDLKTKVIPAVKEAIKTGKEISGIVNGAGMKDSDSDDGADSASDTAGALMDRPGKGRWSAAAKARAKQRALNPNSHASKVKAYLKKHPGASLGEASRAVSKK